MTDPVPVRGRTIGTYLDTLGSSAPAPGGGSVAGLVASLAVGLGQMVISLSDLSPELEEAGARLREAAGAAIAASDADETAYGGYVAASKLPKSSPEEKATRRTAMQTALADAARTPMNLAELVASIKPVLTEISSLGNPHVVSDAAIALVLADAAISACLINVRVNLPWLKDAELVSSLETRIAAIENA